ncbi:Permease of the drug/metabolite transporter (DMT) superfamily [Bacillus cereus]|nr:Permease of the drug/metabolite transporter (DMT) superfamily [Bacillus cereus]
MVIFNYILVCIIFGTTFLTIKIGIEAGAPPLFSAGIRFFLAGLILMIIFKLKRKEIMPHVFSKRIMYAGFCLTFMTFATLYWAEQYISSGLAAVLSAMGPMMILLLQAKRNKSKLQKEQLLALIIALIGVVFVSLPGMHQEVSFIWSIACFVLIIGEFFYGIGSIRSKEILSDLQSVSPFLINGIQMFYGGVFLIIASITVEQPNVSVLASWSVQWTHFISYLYRINWWARIILLALIKNKSCIPVNLVICITVNCNYCRKYHNRRTFKLYDGNRCLFHFGWCIFS